MAHRGGSPPLSYELAKEAFDAVQKCNGNVTEASKHLGVARTTLQVRLRRYELYEAGHTRKPDTPTEPIAPSATLQPISNPSDELTKRLRKGPQTIEQIKRLTGLGERACLGLIEDLKDSGLNLLYCQFAFAFVPLAPNKWKIYPYQWVR